MRRPCLVLFFAFSLGVLFGVESDVSVRGALLVCGILWVVVAGLSLGKARSQGLQVAGTIVLVLVVGVARSSVADRALPWHHLSRFPDRPDVVILEGVVSSPIQTRETGGRFSLELRQITVSDTTFRTAGGVLLNCKDFVPTVKTGDEVRCSARLRIPTGARNPGAFDYALYLARKGTYRTGRIRSRDELEIVSSQASYLDDLVVTPLRNHVRRVIRQNLSGAPAALVEGVLLGDKSRVPDAVRDDFSRSGVSHVLAVSGLHVGLVAAGVFFCVRSFGGGSLVCSVTTTLGVWLYALVTGLPPSVVRAASVATLVVWARSSRRQVDGLNALGFAGLVILAVRPLDLLDLGFQLSFAATSGILLLHRPFTEILSLRGGIRWRKWGATPLAVSIAAQLTTAPLIVSAFGQISLIATVANLVVVPIMSGSVGVGLLTVVAGGVSSDLATLLNATNWALLKSALWLAHVCATPQWAAIEWVEPSGSLVIAYFCVLSWFAEPVRKSRLCGCVMIVGLTAANVHVWSALVTDEVVTIRVLDVGQGDGILVSFPNGKHVLFDGGIAGFGKDAGEHVILPVLRHLGIRRLEAIIASHPHADHVGGLVTVMERVEVGHYLDSGQHFGSSTAARIHQLIRDQGITYHIVAAGDSILGFGDVSAVVLHPRPGYVNLHGKAPDGLNNGSVVVKITFRGKSCLLTGDIEHETDSALLAWGERLRSTILKAAHHGSRTSSTRPFLKAVRPRWVAISCGIENKFGHPSPEVLSRYKGLNIRSLRTDLGGCLTFRIGEDGIGVSRFLEGRAEEKAASR